MYTFFSFFFFYILQSRYRITQLKAPNRFSCLCRSYLPCEWEAINKARVSKIPVTFIASSPSPPSSTITAIFVARLVIFRKTNLIAPQVVSRLKYRRRLYETLCFFLSHPFTIHSAQTRDQKSFVSQKVFDNTHIHFIIRRTFRIASMDCDKITLSLSL